MTYRRVRGGSKTEEFERLYRETFSSIFNYLYYHTLNRETAEDLASTVYLKAYRSFDRFDPSRASFSTWVHTIAHNELLNSWRSKRTTVDIDDVPEGVFAVEDDPEVKDDRGELVRKLLATLSDDERTLVYLKYYEGLQNKEIAERLDMNASTVGTKISRIVARLRSQVDFEALL